MSETDLRYGSDSNPPIYSSIDDEPTSKCITLHIGPDRIIFFGYTLSDLTSVVRALRGTAVCLERSLAQLIEAEEEYE